MREGYKVTLELPEGMPGSQEGVRGSSKDLYGDLTINSPTINFRRKNLIFRRKLEFHHSGRVCE